MDGKECKRLDCVNQIALIGQPDKNVPDQIVTLEQRPIRYIMLTRKQDSVDIRSKASYYGGP